MVLEKVSFIILRIAGFLLDSGCSSWEAFLASQIGVFPCGGPVVDLEQPRIGKLQCLRNFQTSTYITFLKNPIGLSKLSRVKGWQIPFFFFLFIYLFLLPPPFHDLR